jgi:hypothetical protein
MYNKRDETKYFHTSESKKWLEKVLEQYPIHLNQYPHPTIRDHLKYFTANIVRIQSDICKVPGAAAARKIKAGSVIGIMSGHVTNQTHSHAILIKNQSIAPTTGDPWAIFSLINEYIWDDTYNNAEFKPNGLIVAKNADINKGDEIFINYSESYGDNWNALRDQNARDLPSIAIQIAQLFPNAPNEDLLKSHLSPENIPENIQRLFHDFSYGEALYPLLPLHDYAPPVGLGVEQWIEFVFRCRWTYMNFCFRRLHDPRGLRHPQVSILEVSPNSRNSLRLRNKPCKRYGGADTLECDGVVPLQPYDSSFPFEYLYQITPQPDDLTLNVYAVHQQQSEIPVGDMILENEVRGHTDADADDIIPQPQLSPLSIKDVLKYQPYNGPKKQIDLHANPTWKADVSPYSLRIAGFNVDGVSQCEYYKIFHVMDVNHIDLLMLIDTRVSTMHGTITKALAQTKHRYRLLYKSQDDVKHCDRVGGVMFIYNERIYRPSLTKLCPVGSTSILHFRFGRKIIHAIATYWPILNPNSTSLWSRMQIRSNEEGIYDTPIEYIKAIIAAKVTEYTHANETCILFGDFNTDVNGFDKYDLRSFTEAHHIHHSSSDHQLQIKSYGGIARFPTDTNCTRIDYQFHNGCHVRSASCFPNDALFDVGSQHRVLFGLYDLTEYTNQKNRYRFIDTIRNVNLQNETLTSLIKEKYDIMYMQQLQQCIHDPQIPIIDKVREITDQSVDIVQKSTSPVRPKWNVYSPQAHASFLELKYTRKMMIHCYSPCPKLKWTDTNFDVHFEKLMNMWRKDLRKHTRKKDHLYQELYKLNVESYGIQYWIGKPRKDIKYLLKDAIVTIKKRLHCRRRKSLRMAFNQKVREIERDREEGRVKQLINLVFGAKKKGGALDYIIQDGLQITDEREVASATKDFFENTWFRALPDDGTHISNDLADWTILMTDYDDFKSHFPNANIPDDIMRILYNAIQQRPSEEKQLALAASLNKEPTQHEFEKALRRPNGNSAAGKSGLSYNMMKIWPDDLKSDFFQLLLQLWNQNITPPYWKEEMINLIPKVPLPSIDQLRPITLLETARKMWSSIMSNRINEAFATGGYLHPSQHGCLKRVGVDEANLGVINQYESSKELTSELYTVYWDKKRAFDRPTKPALYYSLIRMGVTERVATALIELGIGSNTYIKTPLLTKAIIKKDKQTIQNQAFIKDTGTPQGDTPSALMWNTFEDILLTATSMNREGRTSFHTHDGLSIAQENSAFVDDLSSFMGTYDGIQREADIISAFCILFGIEISIAKLRASRIQWGNANIPGNDYILVHTTG